MKTGGWGGVWVALEKPKPPKVTDEYAYWRDLPNTLSPRCQYWVRQIENGWRPNRRIITMGWSSTVAWLGVYVAEYQQIILPKLRALGGEL